LGAFVLSFALVPFQGWAALKGLIRRDEGPWFRTPKTGHITDQVHHLRRLRMLRRWLLGVRAPQLRPNQPPPAPIAPATRVKRPRRVGWVVVTAMAAAMAALAWGSMRAPVSEAAGNPLYLHGTGVSPLCIPTTLSQTPGAQSPACSIQSTSGGVATVFGFTNLPAQTVTAGVWSFTMYWSGGSGNTVDTVTLSVGVSPLPTCAGFTPTIPNAGTTWTTTYGANGANTASPFTVSTSGSQATIAIPAGGSLCLQVVLAHQTGGKPSMQYDGAAGVADTNIIPPSIVVPESLLPFAAIALAIPLVTGRRRLASLFRLVRR
jgi:hypothetical protein